MKRVRVIDLEPGMKTGKNVFDIDGKLLLAQKTIISKEYIDKLCFHKIEEIFIDENLVEEEPPTKGYTIYKEAYSTIKNIMSNVGSNKSIDIKLAKETVDEIVHNILEDSYAFIELSSIRDKDSYTFLHSIDVCIYSLIIAKEIGIRDEALNKLGLGALLHDIGKARIPNEILQKPGALTEEEFAIVKKHSVLGYESIINSTNVDKSIAYMALEHHERWDGKGYPFGKKHTQINPFARIITICDIYDALTSERVYRKRSLPHEAAEYIIANAGAITDPNITLKFINKIAIYPVGSIVVLNTGEIGRVAKIENTAPLRPVIDIFSHRDPDKTIDRYRINLMEKLTVFIEDSVR